MEDLQRAKRRFRIAMVVTIALATGIGATWEWWISARVTTGAKVEMTDGCLGVVWVGGDYSHWSKGVILEDGANRHGWAWRFLSPRYSQHNSAFPSGST